MSDDQARAIVYSGPNCKPCDQVKAFLTEREVDFDVRNVPDKPEWLLEVRDLGTLSVPVTVIGDHVIKGFDPEKLEAALAD